ncbi:MAG: S41 family peptidase [Usitatibacteraceae bacterium]
MRIILAIFSILASSTMCFANPINSTDRREIVETTARLLETRYVDVAKGQKLAQDIRRASSRWHNIRSGEELAKAVTIWLRQQSNDGHFALHYSSTPIPVEGGEAAYSAEETERYYGAHLNHGVQKIERLAGNIMLIDLRVFPPPALAGDVISAMMTVAAQGEVLIIDLRNNGGGMETVNLIAGYLLPPGSPMSGTFDRPSGTLTPRGSPLTVPGRRFGDSKPVYIQTSRRTISAAEALAYDLQALRRAVIVGEVTGGGANPFEYRRVQPHFALSLPEQRSINPITGSNWQGVGVKPDVEVPAEQALERALELARNGNSSTGRR